MMKLFKGFVCIAACACALMACGGSEEGPPLPLPSVSVALAPTSVSVIAGDGQVTLVWEPVVGATSYAIYVDTHPGVSMEDAPVATTVTTSFTVTGLANGTTYYFAIVAVNDVGPSSPSGEVAATPRMANPDAPQTVRATPGYESITITWSPVDRAASYNIYWSTTAGVTKWNGTRIENVTSPYLHAPLAGGTMVFYVVVAVNAGGEGPESAEVSVSAWYPLRRAFVTSTSSTGHFERSPDAGGKVGLAAADAICAARAQAAALAGTFKAWISDDADDAYCRIHNFAGKKIDNCGQATLPAAAGPWIRMDGFPFSESIAQMLEPNIRVYAPVRFDESGMNLGDVPIFTDTDGTGQEAWVASPCANWTTDAALSTAAGGSSAATGTGWTSLWSGGCDTSAHLLCLETGPGGPLPTVAETGKKAFATSVKMKGLIGGVAAGDTLCRERAAAVGLSGTFNAWLSDDANDAVCHVQGLSGKALSNCGQGGAIYAVGPWIRMDGVRVAATIADFVNEKLFAPINVTETLKYLASSLAWTGTDAQGAGTADMCNEWGSFSAAVNGVLGLTTSASGSWTEFLSDGCDQPAALYCLEQ